jgi:ABC-type glycerol-3-phosphate transport system permease component
VRGRIAARVGLVLLVLFAAFPFYWAVVASFTPEATLFREPSLWPRELILDHYRALFTERDFWTPIKNSLIVALTTTVFCVTIGAFAAYALARIEFAGKRAVLAFILAVTMFPQISIVSPLYMLLRSLHLINTSGSGAAVHDVRDAARGLAARRFLPAAAARPRGSRDG